MSDNYILGTVAWAVRNLKSSRFLTDYNFELPGEKTGNDNTLVIIFDDRSKHDAEISIGRHLGSNWRNDWECVSVVVSLAGND